MASPSRARAAASLALLVTFGCNSPTKPAPDPESLAALVVEAPTEIDDGVPFSVVVRAVGADGTDPFAHTGTIGLAVSAGTLSTTTIAMTDGLAAADVTLSGTTGPAVLTASTGTASGTTTIHSVILRRLAGAADDPAGAAIPEMQIDGSLVEMSEDGEGFRLSHNTLLVQFEPATTIGVANALIEAVDGRIIAGIPGSGGYSGLLTIAVPTTDHAALDLAIETLRASPAVRRAFKESIAAVGAATRDRPGMSAPWVWERTPAGGNWGLELIRAPQMWNLNANVAKSGVARTETGIVDNGFDTTHVDLDFEFALRTLIQPDSTNRAHGTHVSGTIGAAFAGSVGIEGVNPFADLRGVGIGDSMLVSEQQNALYTMNGLVRVVNLSLGYKYRALATPLNPGSSATWQARLQNEAESFVELLDGLGGSAGPPLLVTAAGNDSNPATNNGIGLVEAKFGSGLNYAALELGNPNILVVESIQNRPDLEGGALRSAFSNWGGHVSAPGSAIFSTVPTAVDPTGYRLMSGTSMAAPHVTGLAAFLVAVDPDLSNTQLAEILTNTAVPVAGGAAPRIDGFAALMDIDRVRGNDAVLTRMLDIDDGTPDGNRRRALGETFTTEDADGDGGIGDGAIDMSDFRRFRDWLLQVENTLGTTLDGAPDHAKKDVNGDGAVGSPAAENVFPRGDFNGDGFLDRDSTRYVGGAVAAEVTDLQVLQLKFVDPWVAADALPGLLESFDLHFDATALFEIEGATSGSLVVEHAGENVTTRPFDPAQPLVVVTLPEVEGEYDVTARLLDAQGGTIGSVEHTVTDVRGADPLWRPEAHAGLTLELTVPERADTGAPFLVLVRAGVRDVLGDVAYRSGIQITLDAVGGTLSAVSGTTDGDGHLELEGQFSPGSSQVLITATAAFEELDDVTATGTVSELIASSAQLDSIVVSGPRQLAVAHANAYDDEVSPGWARDVCEDGESGGEETGLPLDPETEHRLSHGCSASQTKGRAYASSSVTTSFTVTPERTGGVLSGIRWQAQGSSTAAANAGEGPGVYQGGGYASAGYPVRHVLTLQEPTVVRFTGRQTGDVVSIDLVGDEGGYDVFLGSEDVSTAVSLPAGTYQLKVTFAVEVRTTRPFGEIVVDDRFANGTMDILVTFESGG